MEKYMTIDAVYRAGVTKLEAVGVTDATMDAWILLEYVTGMDRTRFFMEKQKEMPEAQKAEYEALIHKRAERIPVQYLTGEQEFMGLNFKVNEHVLVPRQDTEVLVEEALKRCSPDMRVLDMCTGSGCIAISIAKLGKAQVTAVDISTDALCVAVDNGKKNKVFVDFRESNLFDKVPERYQMIVSNPPYIRTDIIETLSPEVREHEPMLALDGAEDGLYFYKEITKQATEHLTDGGWLLYEIGHDQGEDVKAIMLEAFSEVTVIKDLAGLNRVVVGCYKK